MNQVIIYGAGKQGRALYGFFKQEGYSNLIKYFCDKMANQIKEIDGVQVISYDEAKKTKLPFIIGVGHENFDEVEIMLKNDNQVIYRFDEYCSEAFGITGTEVNRKYVAYYHIDNMDQYFRDAEDFKNQDIFWNKDSEFYKLFSQMNIENVIELACGRGRHVPHYINYAKNVTLVDILQRNIDICKQRFKDYDKMAYYVNNGVDLQQLEDEKYTSLFTYDSMVHFELLDVAHYLEETYRVLVDGGMALFHHSNNDGDYRQSFVTDRAGRSYMSKDIFAYLAYRVGFDIVQQKVIDWNGIKNIDCVTLLKKNKK